MTRTAEILEKIKSVPSLPAAATEVVQLVQNPDVNFTDLARAIEFDPGLTSNVLKLANSSFFGARSEIKTIRDAIVRMGTKNVFQLVITSSVAPIVHDEVKGYNLMAGGLWNHSIAVAAGTIELAKNLGIKVPEYTFTAGLLHDIGKIVMGTFIEVDTEEIMQKAFRERVSFEAAEQEILGIDHAEVGAQLLESWNIPFEIVEVVRWHHNPDGLDEPNNVVDLVHIADAMSMSAGIGTGSDGLNYHTSQAAVERVNLSRAKLEVIIGEMYQTLATIPDIYGTGSKE